jgi:hypothetical protein
MHSVLEYGMVHCTLTMNHARLVLGALLVAAPYAAAQDARPATTASALGTNVLIGGITAGARAVFERKDVSHAFALGALGGALHFGGKYVATSRGSASGWAGTVIASTGTSMVVNAGAGVSPLSEIAIPVAALRIRIRPQERRARVTVNAFDAGVLAAHIGQRATHIDWWRSAATGTFVAETENRDILADGRYVLGLALGPFVLISDQALDPVSTWKHEAAHVQQYWFAQEAIGRPIENALRTRTRVTSWIPTWVDFGVVAPALVAADHAWFGQRGLSNLYESEAHFLEQR